MSYLSSAYYHRVLICITEFLIKCICLIIAMTTGADQGPGGCQATDVGGEGASVFAVRGGTKDQPRQ